MTPDLWAAGLEGDITIKGTTSDLDVGFSDLLDDLDYGGALHIEGRKGKWSVLGDVLFLKLSGSESGNVTLGPLLDRQIGPIDLSGPGVSIEADVEVEVTQALVELGLGYSVLEQPIGDGDSDRSLRLDVIGGARYWYLKTELDVDISASLGPLSETASFNLEGSKDWIDPFVGARVQADLTEKLFVRLRGDVGGFGVGSDFTWKAAGLFHYQKSPRLSFYAGYQALDVDYEDGSGANKFALDATMHGPVLGFALHFGGRRGEATDRL